jgi:hypothetical protein
MVRFSDLLGGGDNDDEGADAVPQATISEPSVRPADPADPYAALAGDVDEEPETPEDLLARLAEYAATMRPLPDKPTEGPTRPHVDLHEAVGDDLLPRKARS